MNPAQANRINKVMHEYDLSSHAVELHTAYLAGAQVDHLGTLQDMGVHIAGSRVLDPQDPQNPAEISWYFGWGVQQDYLTKQGKELTIERRLGLLAATIFSVDEILMEATHQKQDIVIPLLYKRTFPSSFADYTTVRVGSR